MANPFVPNMPQNDPIAMLRQNPQQAQQMMTQFRSNPAQMLMRLGYNIPPNLTTPDQIGPYLLQSGQISKQQVNQLMALSPQLGGLLSK